MKTKERISNEVKTTMDLLESPQIVEVNHFLAAKVKHRLSKTTKEIPYFTSSKIAKPAFIFVLVIFNLLSFAIIFSNNQSTIAEQEREIALTNIVHEYNIVQNDYLNY